MLLLEPIHDGSRRIDTVEVRLPSPLIDLTRPPAGTDESQVRWAIAHIVDLPSEVVARISVDDCERIITAHGELVARLGAAVRR